MMARKTTALLFVCYLAVLAQLTGCGTCKDQGIANAPGYPSRPITLIVPVGVGGGPDLMARAMARVAVKQLGQPLVIKNVPGGSATKGWNELAGAPADGYTIGVTSIGVILQPIYGSTRYHYLSALEPLAQVMTTPIVAAVRADQPWESINDVVKYAQHHPGSVSFGHVGLGAARHLVGEMFAKEADIQIKQVPFDSEPESLAALLGGHIQLVFIDASIIKDHVRNGRVKVLAVAAEQRLADPLFRDVPTFREQGLDVVFDVWYGIGAPKRLPPDVKKELAAGLKRIIHEPEFQASMENMGMAVVYLDAQEFGEKWLDENARLRKSIRETGMAELVAKEKY